MNLAKFSVKNSLLVNIISVFLVVAGIVAAFRLKREAFPDISFDTVVITTPYPGSTPHEVEKQITIPVEKELKQVDDIREIYSASAEGISVITLVIDEDADNKDKVINDIQRAVDRAEDLPADLDEKPLVQEITTRNKPVITISLGGRAGLADRPGLGGNLSEAELQRQARTLEKKILDLKSVGKVARDGWRDPEIWVEVKPETMKALHVSLSEVIEALKKQNVGIPGGSFYGEKGERIIRVSGEFETAEEVAGVVIRGNIDGNWIKVGDVASVHDDFEEAKIITKTNGSRSINLTVVKKASGDIIDLVDDLKKITAEFQKTADRRLEISHLNDFSYYVKRRLNVLVSNGWIGMILVVVCLFTFLSFRVAIGASIGIPTAVMATLAMMYWFGITINLLTMFGMIMVLGMLVDEDIVISENIHRYLQMGKSNEEATLLGANEVGRSVIATVATTIAAFVPLALMSGIMGKFVRNIPLIVNLTLLASLMEALLILPSHISDLTRKIHRDRLLGKKPLRERPFFVHLLEGYRRALQRLLPHRYIAAGALTVALILSMADAFFHIPFILFPSRGVEIFFIRVEGEPTDRLEDTDLKIAPIEKIINTLPKNELDSSVTQIGIVQQDPDDPFTNRGSHLAQIAVYLTPESKRERTADEIIEALRPEVNRVSEFKTLSFDRVHTGPPVGRDIQVRVRGDDFAVLEPIAQKIADHLKTVKGVSDVKDDYEPGKEELTVEVDPKRAAQALLTTEEVARGVREAFEGWAATTIKKSDEEIDVVVKFPLEYRWKEEAVENLLIPNRLGNLIPLNQVARLNKREGIRVIKHYDGTPAVHVYANVDEKTATPSKVNALLAEKFREVTKPYPGYSLYFGGEEEDTRESLASLKRALYIAVGLIFIILVSLFRSLIQPLIVVFTLPFGFIGVVIGFEIHQLPLSFMALLGCVGLAGIVCDSALLMIDFINNSRKQGRDKTESILEGSALRFRAIILTTLTTVLGILPASAGIGGFDPFIQPMALAMNYGLAFGAVLSLFFVPCLVAITDDLHGVYARYFGNSEKNHKLSLRGTT